MRLREWLGCLGWSVVVLLASVAIADFAFLPLVDIGWLPEWGATTLATIVGVGGIMYVYTRYYDRWQHARTSEGETTQPTLDHYRLAAHIQYSIGAATLLPAIVIGVVAYLAVPALQRALYFRPATDLFFIPIDPLAATLPAGLLGGCVVFLVLERRLVRQYGTDWEIVARLIAFPLSPATGKVLAWATVVVCAVWVGLTVNCYTRITREGFYFNRFWSLREKFYPHAAVIDIGAIVRYKHARTGNIQYKSDPYYAVRFRDSYEFWTVHTAHRYDYTARQLMVWLSRRTGVPLREATLDVDW